MRNRVCATFVSWLLIAGASAAYGDTVKLSGVLDNGHSGAEPNLANGSPETRYLQVIDALKKGGYTIESVSITFLNRAVIRASNPLHLREIVISRASGEILRDAIVEDYSTIPLTIDGGIQLVVPEMIIQNSPSGILIITK